MRGGVGGGGGGGGDGGGGGGGLEFGGEGLDGGLEFGGEGYSAWQSLDDEFESVTSGGLLIDRVELVGAGFRNFTPHVLHFSGAAHVERYSRSLQFTHGNFTQVSSQS